MTLLRASDAKEAVDERWSRHPAFDVLSPWLQGQDRPHPAQLNAIVRRSGLRPFTRQGGDVRFEFSSGNRKPKALDYEREIFETARIPLRLHDWHDAFNALCWIAWPALKSEMNAIHATQGVHRAHGTHGTQMQRGPVRDALTLLDESGLVVLSAEPELSALLVAKQWKALFVGRRDDVLRSMRFLVCGHALFDKLRAPYPSITGRALIIAAPPVIIDEGVGTQRMYADAMAASIILSHLDRPAPTLALPIAGIPGWAPGNDREDFYDDASIFRPPSSISSTAAPIASGNSATDSHNRCAPAPVSSSALP